jgi:hypothetical protein
MKQREDPCLKESKMKPDLEFCMLLDYPVEIRRLADLGRCMFTAAGDTADVKHGFTRYRTA